MIRHLLVVAAFVLVPLLGHAQTGPQPALPKEKLVIVTSDGVSHPFQVEMAISSKEQTIGLMFRPSVPENEGMLFDWGQPRDSTMWMKNTIAPLDMVFIDSKGAVHRIAENTTPESLATIPSGGPVRATLELAAGTAARLHIRVGDKIHQRVFGNAS
jgi:uncharacterized membrane protein (UPF0127 family)